LASIQLPIYMVKFNTWALAFVQIPNRMYEQYQYWFIILYKY